MAAIGLAASANAQLASGTIFPDFTVTDINGVSHTLYTDLAAGKTVFIDISATWCAPCWSYHTSGALDSVWAKHGPTGASGVDVYTTNDAIVYFFQGEPTSGMAELTLNTIGSGAVTTGGTHANFTQGNWVAGTHYYIVDDSTAQGPRNTLWHINYFPTVYMICRDHIVTELTQPTEPQAYAAAQATCPSYAPSATVDAKAVPYMGSDFFVCSATPSVTFQNYGATTITTATITVKDGLGTTVATQGWTGSLATYATANVAITSFAGTSFSGYKYSVSVTGDTHPANDVSVDSVFKIYTASNAAALPCTENFEAALSYKEDFSSPDGNLVYGAFTGQIGIAGTATNALIYRNYYAANTTVETYVLGNFNTTGATNLNIQFDVAYAQYAAADADALAVKVSTNCGTTWTTAWTQSGTTLATAPVHNTGEYYPTAAAQWKHVTVSLASTTSTNTMVEFVGTSNYGNDVFVDNINLSNTVDVPQVQANNVINIAPNPAKDFANINLNLAEAANVQVQVLDAVGRVINTINQQFNAGIQKIEISTATLPAGLYNVKISTGNTMTVKQLSVIK